MTLFVAGYETTSTALTWALYVLSQHPDVLDRLRDEVDHVVGSRLPTFADYPNLVYTRQVLSEVMRLYPPVALIARAAVEADTMNDYPIAAGTPVWLYIYGVHHHPEYWKNPDQFDPERFSEANREQQHKYAYIPFIEGPRQCLGRDLAMMEGTFALSMLAQSLDFTLMNTEPIAPQLGNVLKPGQAVQLKIHSRT
jgi:cytochrome P450